MFNRQFTQHTLESINPASALWKVIHAVLNASVNGCLTTREVENAIRWHFPKQHFTQSNVGYSLSHSRDFKQVGFGGKGRRRWILTGTSDGIKRRGVATAHHSPTRFVRRYTHFTLGYVASEPGKIAMWKACHAVINASTEGCLTTGEVEEALRLLYPDRTIKRSTVCYNLTESKDFKQVYLGGKTPGRWFLTGEVRGINRTNPDRAMELQVPIDVFSTGNEDDSDDDSDNDNDDLATPPDTPPAAGLPYPSKTEEIEAQYSPDPTISSPTLSSSLTTIMIAALPRRGGGVHYSQPIRCGTNYQYCPVFENAQMCQSPPFDSHVKTQRAQGTASTTYLNNYTSEQVFPGLDALPGLLGPFPPPYSTSNDPLSPTSFSFPNPTRDDVFLRNPDNVELYPPTISFGGETASTSLPRYEFAQEHRLGEFLGEWSTAGIAPRPVYSPTVAGQQVVPNAHHLPAYPTYRRPNTVCSGSYDCIEMFGAWNAPEQTQTNAVVTGSGVPFGETYSYLVS